ncbi:MAG: hypothetical protein MST10_04490 [Lentisphaeria bacterium]|nr:hypothetical protein [Lentisphaeria bacterium]
MRMIFLPQWTDKQRGFADNYPSDSMYGMHWRCQYWTARGKILSRMDATYRRSAPRMPESSC